MNLIDIMNEMLVWLFILLAVVILILSGKFIDKSQIIFRIRLICVGVISALLPQQIKEILDISLVGAFIINILLIWVILEILRRGNKT